MNIGIIGGGAIGKTYGRLWHQAGHDIFISSRHPERLAGFVEELGGSAQAGAPEEAAAFGEVVLLAVNYVGIDQAIAAIRPHVADKVVIDATNPLRLADNGSLERTIPLDAVAGVVAQEKLPEARIAKSLTSLWTGHVERRANRDEPQVAMPLAADDPTDRQLVASLVKDAGLVPVDVGTLASSAVLDPQSPLWNVVLTASELTQRLATRTRTA
ncbi:MAG: NAD(P)-binding domain-containing protein [Myxococcota bacterium]